jgi:hypothetical protein
MTQADLVEAPIPSLHGFAVWEGEGTRIRILMRFHTEWRLAWNVSSRERRIEPFVDIPYLVTDNVVVVAPCRARVLGDVYTISSQDVSGYASRYSKNGDKRVTGSGISSKQDGDTRAAWRVRGVASFGTANK